MGFGPKIRYLLSSVNLADNGLWCFADLEKQVCVDAVRARKVSQRSRPCFGDTLGNDELCLRLHWPSSPKVSRRVKVLVVAVVGQTGVAFEDSTSRPARVTTCSLNVKICNPSALTAYSATTISDSVKECETQVRFFESAQMGTKVFGPIMAI